MVIIISVYVHSHFQKCAFFKFYPEKTSSFALASPHPRLRPYKCGVSNTTQFLPPSPSMKLLPSRMSAPSVVSSAMPSAWSTVCIVVIFKRPAYELKRFLYDKSTRLHSHLCRFSPRLIPILHSGVIVSAEF